MRVLVVGEGEHEACALPELVCRLQRAVETTSFDRIRHGRRLHGKGPGLYRKAVGWIRQGQQQGFDAVVFLIDEDGEDDRRRQMDQAQRTELSTLPRACGVAIRTFDAWFLADEQGLSRVLGTEIQRQPEPERERNPKDRCQDLVNRSAAIGSLGELYAKLAESLDLDILAERCPQGFAPFAERVRSLNPA